MKRHSTPGRQRGTTLVEAATVIAIVSIVTAVALVLRLAWVLATSRSGFAFSLANASRVARTVSPSSSRGTSKPACR